MIQSNIGGPEGKRGKERRLSKPDPKAASIRTGGREKRGAPLHSTRRRGGRQKDGFR